jgi:cytochrome c oxidase cbb3-type subunit 3
MPEKRPHSFDGIEEYDNPLPRWWVYMFYGTIVWGLGYQVAMPSWFGHGTSGWTQLGSYAMEVAAAPKQAADAGADAVLAAMKDPHEVLEGKAVFGRNCASCHGPKAEGDISTNRTQKGMPTWKTVLKPREIAEVAAFVHGLSHPADPHRVSL